MLEEEKMMLQDEEDGNKCIQTAWRSLDDVNKTLEIISTQLTSEESSAVGNKFDHLLANLEKSKERMEAALNAARQGKEYYKKSQDASFEIISRQGTQQLAKIPFTGEYPCGLCHFKSGDKTTVEKHIREYHRPAANEVIVNCHVHSIIFFPPFTLDWHRNWLRLNYDWPFGTLPFRLYGQIWTQGILRHILGPILVIFEICHFLTIPGPFEYFSENGWSQKIKVFSMKEQLLPPLLI